MDKARDLEGAGSVRSTTKPNVDGGSRCLDASGVCVEPAVGPARSAQTRAPESAPFVVVEFDDALRVLEWNEEAERVFACSAAKACSGSLPEATGDWEWDQLATRFVEARSCGRSGLVLVRVRREGSVERAIGAMITRLA